MPTLTSKEFFDAAPAVADGLSSADFFNAEPDPEASLELPETQPQTWLESLSGETGQFAPQDTQPRPLDADQPPPTGNIPSDPYAAQTRTLTDEQRQRFLTAQSSMDDSGTFEEQRGSEFLAVPRGVMQGIGKTLQGAGWAKEEVSRLWGGNPNPDKQTVYRMGRGIEDLAEDWFPRMANMRGSFLHETLPEGFGQMVPMVASGAATYGMVQRATQYAPQLSAMLVGAGIESAEVYADARRSGMSPNSASLHARLGVPIGLLEALGMPRILKALKGQKGWKPLLKDAAKSFVENSSQEAVQTVGENLAHNLNTNDRSIWEGVGSAYSAGGIIGAFMTLGLGALGGRLRRLRGTQNAPGLDQAQSGGPMPLTPEEMAQRGLQPTRESTYASEMPETAQDAKGEETGLPSAEEASQAEVSPVDPRRPDRKRPPRDYLLTPEWAAELVAKDPEKARLLAEAEPLRRAEMDRAKVKYDGKRLTPDELATVKTNLTEVLTAPISPPVTEPDRKALEAPTPSGQEPATAVAEPTLRDRLRSRADEARKRMAERRRGIGTLFSEESGGLDPEALSDAIIIGADFIAQGVTDIAEFTKRMVAEFGETIRTDIQRIYDGAKAEYGSAEEPPATPNVADATPNVAQSPEGVGLNVAEIDSLRQIMGLPELQTGQSIPNIEALESARRTGADQNAISTAQAVIASPRQLTLEEEAGMLLKRATLESEFRANMKDQAQLIQDGKIDQARVKDARNKAIINEIDTLTRGSRKGASQIARALQFRRTLIDPQTYEIVHVLTRATVNKGEALSEAETSRFTELAEAVKAAETKIKELEAKVAEQAMELIRTNAEKVVSVEREKAKIARRASVKRRAIAAEREDILNKLRGLATRTNDITGVGPEGAWLLGRLAVNHVKSGVVTLEEVVQKVIADVKGLPAFADINESDVLESINAKDPTVQKKAVSDVRKKVQEIKTLARLTRAVEKAETGVFDPPKGRPVTAEAIQNLQRRLAELRREAYRTTTDPQRMEQAIKTINELQDMLANGWRKLKTDRKTTPQELKEARDKAADLRRRIAVEDQLADLKEQLKTGDFKVPPQKPERAKSPELEKAEIDLRKAKRAVNEAIDNMKPLTVLQMFGEAASAVRAIQATADMSATFRQGAVLAATRPGKFIKYFAKSVQAFFSDYTAEQIDNNLRAAPDFNEMEMAGLELTDFKGLLTAQEEFFGGRLVRLIERIPGFGWAVKASNRHMTTFLNLFRVGVMREFMEKYPDATREQLAGYADFINVASGRGNLGRLTPFGRELGIILFAPKFAYSRFQTPYMLYKYMNVPGVRKQIAKDLAGAFTVGMSALAVAMLAGAKVGWDPRESDFLKLRIGKQRFDIWAGFQQPFRLLAHTLAAVTDRTGLTGEDLSEREKEFSLIERSGRFAMYKLSPAITIPTELLRGRTVIGEKVEPETTALKAVFPLFVNDVIEAYKEDGWGAAGTAAGASFFGVGVSTYGDNEATTRKEIRRLKQEGKLEEAYKIRVKWNQENPKNKIRRVQTSPN